MGNLFSNLYYLAPFPALLIVYYYIRRIKDDSEHGGPDLQTHERRGNENNGDVSEEDEKEDEAETNGEKQEEESKHHSSSGKHKRKNRKCKEVTVIKTDPSPSSGKPSLDDKALLEDLDRNRGQRNQRGSMGASSSPRAGRSNPRQDPVEASKTRSKLHSSSKSQDRSTHGRSRSKDKQPLRSLNKSKERAAGRRPEQTGSRSDKPSDKPSQERAGRRSRPPLQERPGQSDAELNKRPTKSLSKEALSGKENCTPHRRGLHRSGKRNKDIHQVSGSCSERSSQHSHSPSRTSSPPRRPCSRSPDPRRRDVDRQESPQRNEDTDTNNQLETVRSSPMPDDEVKVGDLTFNRSNVLKIDGECSAIVFRGQFNRRSVAVKRIPLDESTFTDQKLDLMREADDHPNIVRLFVSTKDPLFQYIAFSSFEATLFEYVEKDFDRHGLEPVMLFQQFTEGLGHLHSLKIVHNGIKPKNILVSTPDPSGQRRLMISGFENASSCAIPYFHAFDIKAAGKVLVFVQKPFINNIHNCFVTMDLMIRMGSRTVLSGLIGSTLKHPFFWKPKKLLDFFQEVSDRIQKEPLDGPIMRRLESWSVCAVSGDWLQRIDAPLRKHLTESRFRRYDGRQVRDLLRAIRNLKHHYWELPDEVQKTLGFPPDGFVSYFTSRFAFLLMHTYEAMSTCSQESAFQPYYPRDYRCTRIRQLGMTSMEFFVEKIAEGLRLKKVY